MTPIRGLCDPFCSVTRVHGNGDPLVPVAAALEHHQLVPQSQLKVIDGDHFMVFQRPRVILEPMEDFLRLIAQAAQS